MEDPCSETEDDPDSSASFQAAMDPVTASLGPMGPLLRQLHSPTTLPGVSKGKIQSLKEELEGLCTGLKDVSEAEDPSLTAKCWMKQVRELLYDANDFFDEEKHSSAGKDALDEFEILEARAKHASERRKRYGIDLPLKPPLNKPTIPLPERRLSFWDHFVFLRYAEAGRVKLFHYLKEILLFFWNLITSFVLWVLPRLRPVHTDLIDHKLANLLGPDGEKQPKVVSIVGPEGVGKTTVAKRLYHKLGWQFNCRAFVRVSPKPDMRRLLASILIQIQRKQPAGSWDTELLIEEIAKRLRNKRYFIIIDDLWTTPVWDIISRAFPDSDCHSRIIMTTQIEDVALACCSYQSDYIFKMNPLNDDQSRQLFFNRVLGSKGEDGCPKDFKEVSYGIIRKCGGLPLATIYIAGLLLRREMGQWENVQRSLSSTFRTNGNPEGMEVVNLIYNDLPRYLKTCLLYLIMYPEDYTIGKNDLVKQWVAEGFIKAVKGEETEKTAEGYFDELVSRGIIQPVDTNYKSEVVSCAVHHLVLDLIRYNSMEENFITTVDNFESTPGLPDKVRRLSVQFGGAKSANIPECIRMSKVRSLLFYGFFKCVPSIVDCRLLQVLILDIWADQDKASFDLTRICELFRLRYLKIECNITVVLPDKIQGLQHLRTLQIDARLSAVPSDIGHLEKLLHLCLPSQANPPAGIGHMTSLRKLRYFNLSNHSRDNVLGLGKLINLRDLRLTCSTVESNSLVGNIKHLDSILGKLSKLKSLILDAGASSSSISWDGLNSVSPAPALLERLELPRSCIFPSLPRWFGELRRLRILKIAVSELSREDIDILKGLDALTALSLYVWITPAGGIVFGKEGFGALRYFKFTCTAPCLTFEKDAMPNVQRLKLRFNANGLEQYDPVRAGFEHLLGLKEISVKIGSVSTDEYDSIAALWMNVISKIPSSPIFNMQSVDRIFQELHISGHGGPSCPTWLGDELAVEALQSLHPVGVSWEVFPSLGKMRDLRELTLEHIATMKEFVIEQSFCRLIRLTLIGLGSFEKWVPGDEQAVHLFPLLQVLIIRDCPKLLELPFSNHIVYPLEEDRKIDWFSKLQELEIKNCPEFSSVIPIFWTETLCSVKIEGVKLLWKFEYSKSSSDRVKLSIEGKHDLLSIDRKHDLHSLDQVLVFNKETGLEELTLTRCPPLELRHLLMLTSLKTLIAWSCDLVGPLGGQGDVKWQLPVECLEVHSCDATGRELTELLAHLPRLSSLVIRGRGKITQLVVGVDLQKKTSTTSELEEDEVVAEEAAEAAVEQEKEEDGVLLLPPHLSDSLRELNIEGCPELVLVAPPTLLSDDRTNTGGGLQALRSLQRLEITWCPEFLSAYSVSSRLFPSSLQDLELSHVEGMGTLEPLTSLTRLTIQFSPKLLSAWSFSSPSYRLFPSSLQFLRLEDVEGMGTLEPLSNLTSLTQLEMSWCGVHLRCEGLLHLLTTGGHLSELNVYGSRRFFADWDPRSEVLQVEGGGEQQLQLVSTLRVLSTFDAAGLLAAPICSFLSSSLTKLQLSDLNETCFSKEQEDALHLLASLQELEFYRCYSLKNLPAGLHKLTNLKRLKIYNCGGVRSLPKDGLPKSLQELDVSYGCNEELIQQCRGLVGTIPEIRL